MEYEKLKWFIVDKNYVNYLKDFDNKVENIDYKEKLKPYIGILISINNFKYYVPISSVKEKHYRMIEGLDLIKIKENEKILGVLNLNNMIPIKDENIQVLNYKEIDKFRKFKTKKEKKLYIALLSLELNLINDKCIKIKKNAKKLYYEKINNPTSKISKRCCNFKLLEEKCNEYKK